MRFDRQIKTPTTAEILRAISLVFVVLGGTPAFAQDVANQEAIRIEIENLRETGQLSIGGIDIATGNALAEFYERREFSPTWTSVDKVGQLLELVRTSRDDGLNPDDYHVAAIERAYSALEGGTIPTPGQVAALELMLSDSLLRLGLHQGFGRVDPTTLDSRWNFNSRPIGPDPLRTLQNVIDSPSLAEFANRLYARGPLYLRLRDALKEHRQISADGGWPVIPAGPTLKEGMMSLAC